MARNPSARWYVGDRVYSMCALPGAPARMGCGQEACLQPAKDERAREGGHTDSVLTIVHGSQGLFTAGSDCRIMHEYGIGLFSGSDDRTIKQWNWNTGRCVHTFGPGRTPARARCCPALSPCGMLYRPGHKHSVNVITCSQRFLFSGSMK
eukprot:gene29723-43260_t